MPKILDVKQFIGEQTQLNMERRVSQHVQFINKTPSFPIYFAINKNLSTAEFGTLSIDQYIGPNSPVRFDKIVNYPIFGFPEVNTQTEFDETFGTSSEGYSGEAIVIPGINEPTEGDMFIQTVFNKNILFVINEVRTVELKAKPHYAISFHIDSSDKIPQIERQVVKTYTAIFDNIGTENKVIIEDSIYKDMTAYRQIYKAMNDYYMTKFFKERTTTFEIPLVFKNDKDKKPISVIDKFLLKFMINNRIIVMDEILKSTLMVDFNGLYDSDDNTDYISTIYYAIENKRLDMMNSATLAYVYSLYSNLSLLHLCSNRTIYVINKFINDEISINPDYVISYDLSIITNKCKTNNIDKATDLDKMIYPLVRFLNNGDISAADFKDIYLLNIDDKYKYILIPLLLYIISVIIKSNELSMINNIT